MGLGGKSWFQIRFQPNGEGLDCIASMQKKMFDWDNYFLHRTSDGEQWLCIWWVVVHAMAGLDFA